MIEAHVRMYRFCVRIDLVDELIFGTHGSASPARGRDGEDRRLLDVTP